MKFTPQDITLFFGFALTLLNIFNMSLVLRDKANAPQKQLEERIQKLESEVQGIDNKLKNDDFRIIQLEDGGRVLLKAMGALLSHGIDGNNIEEMKIAREELNDYLIRR